MGFVYVQKNQWFCVSCSKVKCWKLSYMKLLLSRMNLTASSLNNIQNENALSIKSTMVVYFLYSHTKIDTFLIYFDP